MDVSKTNKSLKIAAREDKSQKKKIEPNVSDVSEAKKPTDERIIKLHDPGEYYLKD